jgi:hypothetical protein
MRALLVLCLILFSVPSLAQDRAVDVYGQGGYNDNIFLHADGSSAKRSSLYTRIMAMGWLGWEQSETDKIYVFGLSDNKIMSASTQASSSFFDSGAGYRSELLDEKLEADVNVHLQGNVAGDRSGNEDIIRTRGPRTGSPYMAPGSFTMALTMPSSFFAYGAEASALYKFPDFRFGPVLQLYQRNYQRVRQADSSWRLHLRGEIPIGSSFMLTGEVGKAKTNSNIESFQRDDTFMLGTLKLEIGAGYIVNGDYQYEIREFNELTGRKDTISSFHAGIEKSMMRDFSLLFDLYIFGDKSTDPDFSYTANVLTLGLKWLAF